MSIRPHPAVLANDGGPNRALHVDQRETVAGDVPRNGRLIARRGTVAICTCLARACESSASGKPRLWLRQCQLPAHAPSHECHLRAVAVVTGGKASALGSEKAQGSTSGNSRTQRARALSRWGREPESTGRALPLTSLNVSLSPGPARFFNSKPSQDRLSSVCAARGSRQVRAA